MFDFTADQLNALLQDETRAKLAVEFGGLYYCTGDDPITIDAQKYTPRGMRIKDLKYGESMMKTSLIIEDPERAITQVNYSSRFAGNDLIWHFLLRKSDDSDMIEIFEVTWHVRYCQWEGGKFRLNLFGATGFKRRAGISVFSRYCDLKFKGTLCGYAGGDKTCDGTWDDCTSKSNTTQFRGFRYAPVAGKVLLLDNNGRTVSWDPPPGAADAKFDPKPWRVSWVDWSKL